MNERTNNMKSIREVEKITGVSRRTLQEYDNKKLNLLHPTYRNEGGKWFYDEAAVNKLILITILREVGYERKPIKKMLDDSEFDLSKELEAATRELEKKKKRLEGLIRYSEIMSYVVGLPDEILKSLMYVDEFQGGVENINDFSNEFDNQILELAELTDEDINEVKDNSEYALVYVLLKSICCMKDYSPRARCVQRSVMNFYKKICKLYCEDEGMEFSNELIFSEEFLDKMLVMINDELIVDDWGKEMEEQHGEGSIEFVKKALGEFKELVEVSRNRVTN